MLKFPTSLPLSTAPGIQLIHRGKVRDRYALSVQNLEYVEVSDRLSVHDVILPCLIPGKGIILNAIDIWWRRELKAANPEFADDLVAYGRGIDAYLPTHLRSDRDRQSRGRIIRKLDMFPVELIARGRLFGSAFATYSEGLPICGQQLPEGLKKLSALDPVLFTPTTKNNAGGHDEPITIDECNAKYGPELAKLTIGLYTFARDTARKKGIELLDTKIEVGRLGNEIRAGDELFTPDSSRYSDESEVYAAMREDRDPKSKDKQAVRDWITNRYGLTAKTPLDLPVGRLAIERIHTDQIPTNLINQVCVTYRDLFTQLTGFASPQTVLGL